MTVQQALDMVKISFPDIMETELLVRLNNAIKEMCSESLTYSDVVTLPVTDPSVTGRSWVDGSTVKFTIDPDIMVIDRITADANGDGVQQTIKALRAPVEDSTGYPTSGVNQPWAWRYENGFLYFGKLGEGVLSPVASGTVITLYVKRIPDAVNSTVQLFDSTGSAVLTDSGQPIMVQGATLSENLPLPGALHNAIVSRVLEPLFMNSGKIEQGRYHYAVWTRGLSNAKKIATRGHTSTYNVIIHEY